MVMIEILDFPVGAKILDHLVGAKISDHMESFNDQYSICDIN